MSNGDPLLNCMTQVCCPEPDAQAALAKALVRDGVCAEHAEAAKVAAWIFKKFDLAEAGTLAPYRASVARLARERT